VSGRKPHDLPQSYEDFAKKTAGVGVTASTAARTQSAL
jgi:hypothetical protein